MSTVYILNEDVFPHQEVRTNDWFRMTKAFFLHFWHDLHRETIIGMAWRMYPAIQWLVTQIMLMVRLHPIPAHVHWAHRSSTDGY